VRQATATFSRRKLSQSVVEGAPFKPQDLISNRYLIKDTVAVGPLGYLFRAHDREIDVEVALKVINPKLVQTADERKNFAKNIRLARKLSHPNLVRVYEEGEDQDRPYYTSQYLDGLTLRKIIDLRLSKGQFFSIREIEPILLQIANALDAAHKVGPHSDIKPDNVLVLPDLLKVTDFGVGLAMPRLPFVQAMKARRADRYLAPELVEGREVDLRADIYSMGVILGEMLCGLTPDGAVPELQRRNPEVPQALEGLYRRALNANPNSRFKAATEFMAEIQQVSSAAAPPPLKSRESALGSGSARPRSQTGVGALQLSPRREKPPPPVPEMPPPPPDSAEMIVGSGEIIPPDATQPVAEEHIRSLLNAKAPPPEEGREPTEVIDSGQLLSDEQETQLRVETTADPEAVHHAKPPPLSDDKNRTVIWLVLLTVLGVGVGAGGGYYLLQSVKARGGEQSEANKKLEESKQLEEQKKAEQSKIDEAIAARKAEEERLAAAKKAEEEAAAKDRERQAAEQKAAEAELLKKALADKANKEKADREAKEKALADDKAKAADKDQKDKEKKDAQPKDPKDKKVAAVTPPEPTAKSDGPCPEGTRLVAGGTFKMGTAADDPMMGFDERKLSPVDVAAFCVDLFEFPNKRGVSPTVNVAHSDAKRLCEGKGKRLCTEEEWEKACKGQGNARWPFGNTFDPTVCNTEDDSGEKRSLVPSGRFGKCRSGYAAADMAGNAAEWTSEKLVKGGSFASSDYAVRCSARRAGASISKSPEIGFRCCSDPK
jgi:serine/threonine protein kinase/formylglycine-generating enzyme required for sulfatase activity